MLMRNARCEYIVRVQFLAEAHDVANTYFACEWHWQSVCRCVKHVKPKSDAYVQHTKDLRVSKLVFNIPWELFLINKYVFVYIYDLMNSPYLFALRWPVTKWPQPIASIALELRCNIFPSIQVNFSISYTLCSWLLFINFKNWNAIQFGSTKEIKTTSIWHHMIDSKLRVREKERMSGRRSEQQRKKSNLPFH